MPIILYSSWLSARKAVSKYFVSFWIAVPYLCITYMLHVFIFCIVLCEQSYMCTELIFRKKIYYLKYCVVVYGHVYLYILFFKTHFPDITLVVIFPSGNDHTDNCDVHRNGTRGHHVFH